MAEKPQRKQSTLRRGSAGQALVRVQVKVAKGDAGLIRAVAKALRDQPEKTAALRATLVANVADAGVKTATDIFGSDLPDEVFAGVFDRLPDRGWRDVDL